MSDNNGECLLTLIKATLLNGLNIQFLLNCSPGKVEKLICQTCLICGCLVKEGAELGERRALRLVTDGGGGSDGCKERGRVRVNFMLEFNFIARRVGRESGQGGGTSREG